MRLARRGPGLNLQWTGRASPEEMDGARIATVSADGATIGAGQALDSSEATTFSYALTDDDDGVIAFYLAVRPEGDSALFGRRLLCP